MKCLIAGAVICTLAAGAQAASAPDSWAAMTSRPDARWASGRVDDSFSAGSVPRDFFNGADRLSGSTKHEGGEDWAWLAHRGLEGNNTEGKGTEDIGDDRLDDGLGDCTISAAPEPSTWQLLVLGGALLIVVGIKTTRTATIES